MVCVRRLPGAFAEHDYDDLGAVLGPVLEVHARLARTTLQAHQRARQAAGQDPTFCDPKSAGLFHDRTAQTLLGEAFARAYLAFRPLFDQVQRSLEAFVARHSFDADRNLEMLVRLLGLPVPEAALVRLAAAFCYGSINRSLFAFVNSPSRIVNAVEKLCDVRGTAITRLFDGQGALARSGLLDAVNTRSSRCDLEDVLRLSTVGECLLGTPFESEQAMARAVLSPLAPPPAGARLEWPHLQQQQALMKSALNGAIDAATPGVNFLLYGAPGTGKTEFVRQLVADIGAAGFVVNDRDDRGAEASRSERLASLQLSQTFAGQQARAVLVLDEAEDIFQSDAQHPLARLFRPAAESKAWVNALLEQNAHPVIWISNHISHLDPAYLRRFAYCLEFPQTPHTVRQRIAHTRLGAVGCSAAVIDAMAALPQVTPAHLDGAARFAGLTRASGLGADAAVTSLIDAQLHAAGHASVLATVKRATRFDMRYLSVRGHATPERVLESLARLGGGAGGSGSDSAISSNSSSPAGGATLLFSGPPGTGKTQLASELATRLGRRLVVRTASDINSKWHGESEGNVARMFRDCDPRTELLFLDEAEVLLGAREDSEQRAGRAVTAEFLRWLEVFEGIFIAATNHAHTFDAALTRRFTFRLEFEPLRQDQRVELYAELALGWRPQDGPELQPAPVDAAARAGLARLDHLTPGDFANAARRISALALPIDAWMDELAAEHHAKRGASSARMGFL